MAQEFRSTGLRSNPRRRRYFTHFGLAMIGVEQAQLCEPRSSKNYRQLRSEISRLRSPTAPNSICSKLQAPESSEGNVGREGDWREGDWKTANGGAAPEYSIRPNSKPQTHQKAMAGRRGTGGRGLEDGDWRCRSRVFHPPQLHASDSSEDNDWREGDSRKGDWKTAGNSIPGSAIPKTAQEDHRVLPHPAQIFHGPSFLNQRRCTQTRRDF